MATKGKEVKEPTEPTEPVEPEVVEPTEPKTFTQEELDAQIAEAKESGKAEATEGYKGIQRTVSEKAEEIKRLKSQLGQPRSGSLKTLLEKLARRGADSYDPAEQAEIGQLLSQYGQEEQQAAQQTYMAQKKEELSQKIIAGGFDPNDEQFDSVWDAYSFEEAERRVGRALAKAKPKESKKEETEEQVRERIKREVLEEEGLTKQPAGSPPAGGKRSWTRAELDAMPYAEYKKNEEAIDAAFREGRIT